MTSSKFGEETLVKLVGSPWEGFLPASPADLFVSRNIKIRGWSMSWYFNKMVLQNTLRSDVSAILKSIHVIRAYLSIIA